MLNLRQFNLWAWATYTDTQNLKVAMLLGAIPPKLDRQHEKAWVLLTFPTFTVTQLIYSLQSDYRRIQPSVSPVPSPLVTDVPVTGTSLTDTTLDTCSWRFLHVRAHS